MAGPGGGPPRKSHTKSRKGCRTCKRRHIRCDETFPQCRNCTKHSVRCDYMDMPAAGEEPMKGSRPPDLLMSPELQQMLDAWRLTGESPLPELHVSDPVYWTRFSSIDLRLIHHITTLSLDMHRRCYSACTPWAPKILTLIHVAMSSDFTMSAVLALSASHLAWWTKNADTDNLAYHHRGIALKGLHEAIGAFSERNSEAILAASMLLSWQATEWRSWASLQQGLSTVMNAMRPWVHKSELASYLESQGAMSRSRNVSASSIGSHSPTPSSEDVQRLENMASTLHNLRLRLSNHEELVGRVDQISAYLQDLQRDLPLQSPEEAFERLQPLRSLLFWLPPAILRSGESDLGALALLSHVFALALVLEPLFPEIGGAYLGNMSVVPIEAMHEILRARRNTLPQETSVQVALSLSEVPIQIAAAYKSQRRLMETPGDFHRSASHVSYMPPHLHLTTPSDISASSVYASSPLQSPHSISPHHSGFFNPVPSNVRRDSSIRSPHDRMMGSSSQLSSLYSPQDSLHGPMHTMAPGMEYFGSSAYAAHDYKPSHHHATTRYVPSSSIWT